MKTWRLSVALFGAAVLCGSAVLAGEVNKVNITTDQALNVEGKTLNAGSYKAEWEGTGPNVQVQLKQGKNVVATFPAHLEEQQNKNATDAYGTIPGPNGTRELSAIYAGGKRDVLQIQTSTVHQQQQSSNPGAK
jgi:hypothetical protein